MSLLRRLTLLLLLACALTAAAGESSLYESEATALRPPPGQESIGDELAVGELKGRVVVLDRDGNTLDELGTNNNPEQIATPKVPPEQWSKLLVTALAATLGYWPHVVH